MALRNLQIKPILHLRSLYSSFVPFILQQLKFNQGSLSLTQLSYRFFTARVETFWHRTVTEKNVSLNFHCFSINILGSNWCLDWGQKGFWGIFVYFLLTRFHLKTFSPKQLFVGDLGLLHNRWLDLLFATVIYSF